MKIMKKIGAERFIYLLIFIMTTGWLFYQIYPIIFATHDDIINYTMVRRGNLFLSAWVNAKGGRISHLWNQILLGIPFLGNSVWFYKLFAFGTYLFDLWTLWILLKKRVNSNFASLVCIMVSSLACISDYHNLLISYALCHQLPIAFLFLSLYFYTEWLEKRQRSKCIWSCLFFLLSCMIYEAFAAAIVIFAIIAVSDLKKADGFSQKHFYKRVAVSVLPPLFMAGIYVIVYYAWQIFFPSGYSGTELCFTQPLDSLAATIAFSLSFFPLAELILEFESLSSLCQHINVMTVLCAGMTTAVFAWILPKIQLKKRTLQVILIVSGIGIIIPCLLIGFTTKYIEWFHNKTIAYVPSFYSYLFLIVFLMGMAVFLYKALSEKIKTAARVFMCICVFISSLAAGIVNSMWKPHFEMLSLRYRNFDHVVSSAPFTTFDETWQLYAPDNEGIHLSGKFTEEYLKIYNDANISYITTRDQLDGSKHTLCMRMSDSCEIFAVGEVDDSLYTDFLTVKTILPESKTIMVRLKSGKIFTADVRDDLIIEAPDGDMFDMSERIEVEK